MSSSVLIENKGKDILILGQVPTQGLDDTTLTAEAKCTINFTQPNKRFVLCLHYYGSSSLLIVNATEIYQFKAKNCEKIIQCLHNISKTFTINNMEKTGLGGVIKFFPVDFNPIDTNDISDSHKHLMKRTGYKKYLDWLRSYLLDY